MAVITYLIISLLACGGKLLFVLLQYVLCSAGV